METYFTFCKSSKFLSYGATYSRVGIQQVVTGQFIHVIIIYPEL